MLNVAGLGVMYGMGARPVGYAPLGDVGWPRLSLLISIKTNYDAKNQSASLC